MSFAPDARKVALADFDFVVTVSATSAETAALILAERIGYEEEYPELDSPEYYISSDYVTIQEMEIIA